MTNLIFILMLVFCFNANADQTIIPIDAYQPSAEFREKFDIQIEKNSMNGLCYVTISYKSHPQEQETVSYSDNSKQVFYTDGIGEGYFTVINESKKTLIDAPLHFQPEKGGRTVARIVVQNDLLPKLKVKLVNRACRDSCAYDIYFKNVLQKLN